MKIDVILNPAEIATLPVRNLSGATCVVFDILRATSTVITALAHGAPEIYPVRTIEEAFTLRTKFRRVLLGGERHGELIDGFDLGNSPLEYRMPISTKIITTTTNGTIALRACENAKEVMVGALLNIDAVIRHIKLTLPDELLLICAGTFQELALEDVIAAGLLCHSFPDAIFTDSAKVARSTFLQYQFNLCAGLEESRNGKVLLAKGRGKEVEWCAQKSIYDFVALLKNGAVKKWEDPANT